MSDSRKDLDYLFCPRSIAVIGSLTGSWFGGNILIKQLLDFGFTGKIYAINPLFEADKFQRVKVYPSIGQVPQEVDLALIMTSRNVVPQLVQECGEKGVKAVIIVSDGFAERDEEGTLLQKEIVGIAKSKNLRILGPNTVGVVNTAVNLVTMPYLMEYMNIREGSIAICGQTGNIGPQASALQELRYGISKICDFGNKADISELDILDYLGNDPQTKVIAMHLEDVKDGRRFLAKAKEVVLSKPVLVLKSGRTEEGAKAAASHTGSLAGKDEVYDSAFRQAGIIRADTITELLNFAKTLAYQPLPRSNKLAIVTGTGGGGVMGVDAAVRIGLEMARFSEKTRERLAQLFPGLENNPVDIGPAMAARRNIRALHQEAIRNVIEDENVDCAVIILPRLMTGIETSVEIFRDVKERLSKPIAIWDFGLDRPHTNERTQRLEDADIPVYSEIEDAVKALGIAYRYSQIRSRTSQSATG